MRIRDTTPTPRNPTGFYGPITLATTATLRQIAGLAPGSTLAMTFLLPTELLDDVDRPGLRASEDGAKNSGTPFVSFYTPSEMLTLARKTGFHEAQHVSGTSLANRYFARRVERISW
ncbi:hypothetical protein [Rhodococcus wratislaviensis]|uniref:hypothetical protein n=1 Tax=Rhodococcus wratislaviensis TaxID=44752 RepID=UPI001CEC6EB0|nr:hypothetical protein [Rhodococcus wratislaviensis]